MIKKCDKCNGEGKLHARGHADVDCVLCGGTGKETVLLKGGLVITPIKKRLISFCVETKVVRKFGGTILSFLTKAENGKDALRRLIEHSSDFKHLISGRDSNNLIISVKTLNRDLKEV